MNVGKIRKYLRNAERVLGLVEGKRHGHHRHHGRGHHGKRRGGMGSGRGAAPDTAPYKVARRFHPSLTNKFRYAVDG